MVNSVIAKTIISENSKFCIACGYKNENILKKKSKYQTPLHLSFQNADKELLQSPEHQRESYDQVVPNKVLVKSFSSRGFFIIIIFSRKIYLKIKIKHVGLLL